MTDHANIDHTGLTGVGASAAADVSITDSGGYFAGTDVEAALQELGAGGGGGGGGASVLGKTSTGASSEAMTNAQEYAKKITLPSAGTIVSVGARIQQSAASNSTHGMAAAAWNDNSGAIGLLAGLGAPFPMYLQTDGGGTLPWHKLWRPVGAHFDAGADVWIGVMLQSNGSVVANISYDTGGSDRTVNVGQPYVATGGSVFTQTTTTKAYDIFCLFLPD